MKQVTHPVDGRSSRWQRHRAVRRIELITAARDAVAANGAALSMEEIATACGTSKSVFYRYFKDKAGVQKTLEEVFELFPILHEKREANAGSLSGGQQQMLAVGRALMTRPKLLLLDEPSMGLAPLIVKQIFDIIKEINDDGVTVLLVEQNAAQALGLANRGYVLETGEIVLSGSGRELLADDRVRAAYLGEEIAS